LGLFEPENGGTEKVNVDSLIRVKGEYNVVFDKIGSNEVVEV